MKVISVANQKGGVGKSTTAAALGAVIKKKNNNRVLFIDLDPQGNLSYVFDVLNKSKSSMDFLTNTAKFEDVVINSPLGDIIPSGGNLTGADAKLTETRKEFKLKEALEPIKDKYDYVIIDTPPALGILTINAFACSDTLIIPAQADMFSLQGIGMLKKTIDSVKKYCNPDLKVDGILLTRYNSRSVLSREITALIEKNAKLLDTKVYNTKIRECISLKEAQALKTDIFKYAPKSNAAVDYVFFANEFLSQNRSKSV